MSVKGPLPGQARLTVRLDALAANWRMFADLAPGSTCAAVVKADGYGLGAEAVGRRLAREGCGSFFVAHLGEALALRAALGPSPEIHVLNGLPEGASDAMLADDLRPVLNTLDQIARWRDEGAGRPAALHVDTGMNRLGVSLDEVDAAAEALDGVNLSLIMSHLACASDPAHPKNHVQRDAFLDAASRLPPAPLSLAASAGALLGEDFHFDLIRPGIGLYGGGPMDAVAVPLHPVAVLEAPLIQVRAIGPGDTVGYGATWEADRRRTIGVAALGYADGFLRSGSSRGFAVIAGAVCPILGRVSMDLIALDVTGAGKAAQEGAMAQFLGPAAPIDAQAQACGTIPYELLTRLGGRFHRTYQDAETD
jgi:alanine racemase